MNNEQSDKMQNSSTSEANISSELLDSNPKSISSTDEEIDTIANEMGNPATQVETATDSSEEEKATLKEIEESSDTSSSATTSSEDKEHDSNPNHEDQISDSTKESAIESSSAEPIVAEESEMAEDLLKVQEAIDSTDGENDSISNDEDQGFNSVLKQTKDPSDKEKEVASLQEQVKELNTKVEELQKQIVDQDQQIESLKETSANKDQQLVNLTEELATKDKEIANLNEQINNPELRFIKNELKKQETDLEQDRKELDSYYEQVKKWAERHQNLQKGINSVVEASNNLLAKSREVKEKLPETLQSKLQKRQEGLELIGKMLRRLQEQTNANTEEPTEPEQLPIVSEQELRDLLDSEANKELGQKAIAKKLKEVGTQRWKIISQMRDLAEKRRKNWLNIVDKKILPILDGINDGKNFSANLLEDCQTNNPECETDLDLWFATYSELGKILLEMLESVKVYPMKVEMGKQIDYNRHEPFDVQSDEQLNNEDIKEVTRQGYEYEPEADRELLVLRSAQVVVVKND